MCECKLVEIILYAKELKEFCMIPRAGINQEWIESSSIILVNNGLKRKIR